MSDTTPPAPVPHPMTVEWNLLGRSVAGECSPEEMETIRQWAASAPERAALLEEMRQAWRHAGTVGRPVDVEAMWQRTIAQLPSGPGHSARVLLPLRLDPRAIRWPRVVGIGGAVLFGMALATLALTHLLASGRAVRVYATLPGARQTIVLADGTQLILGPASRVQLGAHYGIGQREITLDGEAYFTVVHDVAHPFVVRARDVTIRDVGTSFDVKAYAEDLGTTVAVAEGRVAVSPGLSAPDELALRPGDVMTISGIGIRTRHDVNVAALTGWRQGHLVFEDTPLRDVIRDLSRTFDLTITVTDSAIASKLVTASFDGEPANEVLDDISHTVGADYVRMGRRVVIRPRTTRIQVPAVGPVRALRTAQREP